MCRGIQEANQAAGSCSFKGSASSNANTVDFVSCELCGSRASLYCHADDAYLCRRCDKWVHEANFLALRHVRCFLCNTCQNLTHRYLIGAAAEVLIPAMESLIERRRQCDSKVERQCSRKLKRPFQFI